MSTATTTVAVPGVTTTVTTPSPFSFWIPSLVGGLIGLFVGDAAAEFVPDGKLWQIAAKATGLLVGTSIGLLLTPNNPATAADASSIASLS